MRSKFLKCAAIASLGVCSLIAPVAQAAGPHKGKAAPAAKAADAKKPNELHADDKSMKKQMGWEDKVLGPDDKRAELDKIARANAINEKAAKEREKQAALEAAAPAPKAAPSTNKKNELAIPQTAEEKALNDSDRGKSHEISPKLASEAAQAPVPAAKPADDKFIDKLLKEEGTGSKKKSASARDNDRELDALLNGAKEKPAGRKHKGDAVDDMIKTADKGPAMPAPRSPASQPDWMKQPEITSTPSAAAPPPPPPVAVKPAPKKDDGVIHVVQGAAVQPAAPPPPAPVASRAVNGRGKKGAAKIAPAPVQWNDPFADKKPIASRDQRNRDEEESAPPPRKAPASRPAATPAAWSDPFADSPEPRRTTRRAPAPAAPPVVAPAAPKRNEKADPTAHPAGWKDPFTKAPAAPARAPLAMREPAKGESSKWEIAAHRTPARATSETHAAVGWAVLKKRR
jgi:hypothetical protein